MWRVDMKHKTWKKKKEVEQKEQKQEAEWKRVKTSMQLAFKISGWAFVMVYPIKAIVFK